MQAVTVGDLVVRPGFDVERLRRIEHQVSLILDDGTAIAPGLTRRDTPGHTPGHTPRLTSTVVSSSTERLIVAGDALHCPAPAARLLPATGTRRWALSG